MKKPIRKPQVVTAKALRAEARVFVRTFLRGENLDTNRLHAAIQVLGSPDRRGE